MKIESKLEWMAIQNNITYRWSDWKYYPWLIFTKQLSHKATYSRFISPVRFPYIKDKEVNAHIQ